MRKRTVKANGESVNALRMQKGWTQARLASIAGIDPKTIQNIEASRDVYSQSLEAVAKALQVEFRQLLLQPIDPSPNYSADRETTQTGDGTYPEAFQSFMEDRTRGFVGRSYVFDEIARFQNSPSVPCGYFVIEGDPGAGKSAILAQYVKRTGCVCHFNMQARGITRYEQFIESIAAQFHTRFQLDKCTEVEPHQDGSLLITYIQHWIHRAPNDARLVIAIDALDEVDAAFQTARSNTLYLPEALPTGLFLVLTTRRHNDMVLVTQAPLKILDLRNFEPQTADDIREYIRARITTPALANWIEHNRIEVESFVTQVAERSENNFMYVRYLLQALEGGEYWDTGLESIPIGLGGYYLDHWRRMGMTTTPLPVNRVRIIYVLSEIAEPLSARTIADFSGVDALTVQHVLSEWSQFLHRHTFGDETLYSIYHASFRDFLRRSDIVQSAGITLESINESIANHLWKQLVPDE